MKPGDLVKCKPYPGSSMDHDYLFEFNEKHSSMYRGEFKYYLSDLAFILEEKEVRDLSGEWIMWVKVVFPTGIGWLPDFYVNPV